MAKLRIGTCSWKYDSWRGLVYSRDENINFLSEYSEKFDTVEIDQWFWSLHDEKKVSLPQRSVAENYAGSVDEDFRFTVKAPNSITLTHFYKKGKEEELKLNPYFLSVELLGEFLKSISPLKNKLGPVMFQFEYLNKMKMISQKDFQDKFGRFAAALPEGYMYSVEIRNPNYLNRKFFDFLKECRMGFVFLQGYYMPQVPEIYSKFSDCLGDFTVIRLHGPDRKGIEGKSGGDWSRIIEPRDEELKKIAEIISDLLSRGTDVYLNVNNHYEGSAPLTIEKMKKLIR